MDVLGSNGNVLRNGSKAQLTQGWFERALRGFFSAICAVIDVPSIQQQRSVSTTAAGPRNRNERFQHIRSFEFAFALRACRSEITAHTKRVVRR